MELNPIYVIEFDLKCQKHKPADHPTPTFRIYIDTDLMAEQMYTWDGASNYVRLRCEVRLGKGKHKLKIVDLDSKNTAIYTFDNAEIDKQPFQIDEAGNFQIT
jgi:hypothetical protein